MDKMRMETKDMTAQNIDKIATMFPNCITETAGEDGKLKKAVNFDLLRQMLSDEVVEGDEAYEFTWVGKKASIVEANKPIRKTLRPCPEESVNWDTTENLYIEGDNLEVLKLLQESYLGKVKMIYIDPPYNTGHDFVYPDSFIMDNEEYNEGIGYYDVDGNVNYGRENSQTAGRYHSDWCSMIYPRLMLARNVLSEDGVIFISIDDNEVDNLRKICEEVFGRINFVAEIIWINGRTAAAHFTKSHEYIIAFAKSLAHLPLFKYSGEEEYISDRTIKKKSLKNPLSRIDFPAGIDFEGPDRVFPKTFGDSEEVNVTEGTLICENGKLKEPVQLECAWAMADMIKAWINNPKSTIIDSKGQIVKRFYFKSNGVLQYEKIKGTIHPSTIFENIGTKQGTYEVENLFNERLFSFPKPTTLIKQIVSICSEKDDTILDFFSGSATTAHAVMQLNAEDAEKTGAAPHHHRKFIMVQLPEPCDEKSEAYKTGYKNICEIGKERIRRAGAKIKEDNPQAAAGLDIGFRVFKLDDSNMSDVYYSADEYNQGMLSMLESNVKPDRTDLDLLFGCLLDWGLPLSMPYKSEQIEGCTVHTYNDGDLIACFDENIPDSVIKAIAKRQPLRAVFRDSSFASSPAKINVGEIFKMLAPDTRVRVI